MSTKRDQREQQRLRGTAYHEAGHAVAAFELRRRFHYLTIVPEPDEGTLGHIMYAGFGEGFDPELDDSRIVRRRLEPAIITALAGGAAEAKLAGRYNAVGSEHDRQGATRLATYLVANEHELDAYVNWLWQRARAMFDDPLTWVAVEALAAELLVHKRIGARRARQIIKTAQQALLEARRQQRSAALAALPEADAPASSG